MRKRFAITRAFTIVELLIVIVIIGILATITIIAYNGVMASAYDSAVKSDIANFSRQVELYIAREGSPPKSTGLTSDLPVGLEPFKLSRDAYSTTDHNFYYCEGNVGGNRVFAVGAVSKSKNKFYYIDGSVRDYTGNWGSNGTNCPGMLPGVSGYTYSYGFNMDTQSWWNWTK